MIFLLNYVCPRHETLAYIGRACAGVRACINIHRCKHRRMPVRKMWWTGAATTTDDDDAWQYHQQQRRQPGARNVSRTIGAQIRHTHIHNSTHHHTCRH